MTFAARIDIDDSDGDRVITNNEEIKVELTLREPTTGLTLSDFELPSGLSIDESSVTYKNSIWDDGSLYLDTISFLVNVAEGINSTGNRIRINSYSYDFLTDTSAFDISTTSFRIDSVDPTLVIGTEGDMSQPLANGESVKVTFSFSEPVANFDAIKVMLSPGSGTLTQFKSESSSFYTALFTPNPGVYLNDSTISVNVGAYSDLYSNYNTSGTSVVFAIDTRDFIAPSPTINIPAGLVVTGPMEFTVSFDEIVKGFDVTDLFVSRGGLELISTETQAQSFIFRYVPDASLSQDGENVSLAVLDNGYTDLAGNFGKASAPASFMVDVVPPKLAVSLADIELSSSASKRVTFTFSEAVKNFGLDDVSLSQSVGSLHDFQPEDADGKVYSAIFTPQPNIEQSDIKILVSDTYADIAGNVGQYAESAIFDIDTLGPGVTIDLGASPDTHLIRGESLELRFAFTEAVKNFGLEDISLSEAVGSLNNFVQNDADGKVYSVTFTPQLDIERSGISITLSGDYTDFSGNKGVLHPSLSFDMDTLAPSLNIATNDTHLTRGESLLLTFTFSEEVANFSADDVRLDGAAVNLIEFTEVNPGRMYTAIYTPPAEAIDSMNIFSVVSGSYADLPGNQGMGASSERVSIDTMGREIFGTVGSDILVGTAGADRISGVPKSGEGAGRGSVDLLAGLSGADVFVLGTHSKAFYNNGNNNSAGTKDFASIIDFSRSEGDKIEVKAGTYFFHELSIVKLNGTGLYLDTNNSGNWDAKDELTCFLVGVATGSVSVGQDLIQV